MFRLILAAAYLAALSTPVSAQLTLDSLYARLRQSPRITAAREVARAAELRVASSRRPPDPKLQLGFMNYGVPSIAPMPTVGMTQLQVMQMLPLGGKLALAGRVATQRAWAASAKADDAEWEVRASAAMGFFDLYIAEQSLAIDRETLRILEDLERNAQSMYRVGEGRQADVLKAQLEITRMSQDTVRMAVMRSSMIAMLRGLVGEEASWNPGQAVPPTMPAEPPTLASLDSQAFANRAMLRAGRNELLAAQSAADLARKEIWPDLELGVQYAQQRGDMGTERMASLMIGASVPVFARSRQYRMRAEAEAMRGMAAADLRDMQLTTSASVSAAYLNLTRSRTLASSIRETVLPQASAVLASALAAYRTGTVDFMTLLDAQMAVNKYRKDLVELTAEEGKAWAELEMLTGRSLTGATVVTGGGR